MRDDLNVSERRLIAALDRIDQFLDRIAAARGGPPVEAEAEAGAGLDEARAENRSLAQELAALQARQADALADCEARLAESNRRLVEAGQETARLSAANEALAAANRALVAARDGAPETLDGQEGDGDGGIRRALEAEIESLRAARAAEVARMGEIIAALERMTAASAEDRPAPAPGTADAAAGVADDEAPVRDGGGDQDGERG